MQTCLCGSLSARRAWIEITLLELTSSVSMVALRKESVDRNLGTVQIVIIVVESLSARRAWIEIIMFVNLRVLDGVALRKESVDRNILSPPELLSVSSRSPQGERG